jgi:hypothetical protein
MTDLEYVQECLHTLSAKGQTLASALADPSYTVTLRLAYDQAMAVRRALTEWVENQTPPWDIISRGQITTTTGIQSFIVVACTTCGTVRRLQDDTDMAETVCRRCHP